MSLDEQRRMRYFTLGNILIFLVGVLVIAAGIIAGVVLRSTGVDWQSVLLNIGSDIIVVSMVFFIGRMLLVDPQRDIEERLARIESKLHYQSSLFLTRDQRNSRQTFEQFIEHAQDLFLGGVALRVTGRGHRRIYRERLEKGAHLRFAVLNPESPDVAAIATMWQVPTEHIASDIRSTLAELKYLRSIAKSCGSGSVEVRLLKREPVFSFALRNVNKPDACLRADMRVFGLDTALRPGWELRPADEPWFQRFVQMCEALWEDSKAYTDDE